jgi:hypothetical protein
MIAESHVEVYTITVNWLHVALYAILAVVVLCVWVWARRRKPPRQP